MSGEAERLADALAAAERRAVPLDRRLRIAWARVSGPRRVACRIFSGRPVEVIVPEIVGNELYRRGYIEPSVTRVMIELVRPGMVVFDVGAHYGYHAVVAADLVGPSGAVVAFEPADSARDLLSANVTALANVSVEATAVGDRCGTVTLHDFGVRHSAVNTVAAGARVPPRERRRLRSRSHPVRCTTLDAFSDRTGLVPDVVKLDIEGAELAAVGGMRRLLEERSPLLSVETGDYAGMASPRTAEVIELLERLGYVAHEWDGSSLRRHERRSEYGYGNLFFRRAN